MTNNTPTPKTVKRLNIFHLCDSLNEATSAILSEPNLLGAEIKINNEGKYILQMIANVVEE